MADLAANDASRVEAAKILANENYEEWGQWVIETMTDEEILDDLNDYVDEEAWVSSREGTHRARTEIINTRF